MDYFFVLNYMKYDSEQNSNRENKNSSFMGILADLILDVSLMTRQYVQQTLEQKRKMAMKKAVGGFMLALGFLFLLVGIVQFLGLLFDSLWLGYLVVGIVIAILGWIFSKS